MAKYRFAMIIESGEHNYSAHIPDLDGVVTTGATVEEIRQNMQETLEMHLGAMMRDGGPIPAPPFAEYIDVDVH